MRKLSLFSGIGGMDLAAHWAGMETVAFCEREPFPQRVLQKNFPSVPIYDDVCTLTKERLERDGIIGPDRAIDIVSAGYPCQPESQAGKRKGKEDDRWLWPQVRRILDETRPPWFVGENVFGHVSMGLDTVLHDLEDDDYAVEPIVIPACAVGAPHRRDRVFVLAYTESVFEGRRSGGAEAEDAGFTCSGEDVADPNSFGCMERKFEKHTTENREQPQFGPACCTDENRRGWTTESRLGGVLDGLSDWMDRHQWPAGLGAEQYEWEPTRVAMQVKNRPGRIKALGNAVNPYQIYPILAAIKAINDQI